MPAAGRRAGRRTGNPARQDRDLQGKDPGHQGKDQVGAVLSRRNYRGRLHHHGRYHDFRNSCVQAGVHELRCGPAGTDAVRDGNLGLLRQILVPDIRYHDRRHLGLSLRLETLEVHSDTHGPTRAARADLRRPRA